MGEAIRTEDGLPAGVKSLDITTIADEFRVTQEVRVEVGRLVIEPVSDKQNGWQSNVLIDGVKQDGVRALTLRMEVGHVPVLTVERHIHRR